MHILTNKPLDVESFAADWGTEELFVSGGVRRSFMRRCDLRLKMAPKNQMSIVDSAEKPPADNAPRACRQHFPVAIRRAMSTSQTAP